ncbi:MAG: hypothetical protein Fur005_36690 [Roseiflexaceae bacterium]
METVTEGTMTAAQEAQELIEQGQAAALAGDTFAARSAFRRASELDQTNAEAWIGLSGVVPILSEKREYLRRALAIAPDHREARISLDYVEKLIGQGMQLAPTERAREKRLNGDASPLLSAPEPEATTETVPEVLHCYIHPERETGLRCVQCNRPICGQCAQISSVGQLCPECRKARRPANYQLTTGNIVVGSVIGVVSGVLSSVAVLFIGGLPLIGLILAIMAGPAAGELTVRLSDRITKSRRGRGMQFAIGGGLLAGMLPMLFFMILAPSLMSLIAGLFAFLAISTTAARLR